MSLTSGTMPPANSSAVLNQRRTSILIVDNDENLLIAFERALEDEGYSTATAVGLDEALKHLSQNAFELLVLDDHLSDFDSIDVLMELRRAELMPPAAVVTYHQPPTEREQVRLRLLGVTVFINKSAPTELVALAHRMLGNPLSQHPVASSPEALRAE